MNEIVVHDGTTAMEDKEYHRLRLSLSKLLLFYTVGI